MAQDIFEQLHAAVKQAESQGKRFDEKGNLLTSPKGAQGEMQVMPKTAKSPGFGVAPAQDKSPDELARVGKDYLKAMVDKYGDTQKAVIAYNWGPGNTDKWLAAGADPKALPAETQGYVARISKTLGGDKLAPLPAAEPTQSEKTMTKALGSGMSAQNMIKDAGPGYKAAMAMMFLADDKPETGEDDIWKEAEAPVEEEDTTPNAFAGLDLGYQSPFPTQKPTASQQLARFAQGGAVHRSDGSPMYGEIAIGDGGITEDTRTALARPTTARAALDALKSVGADVGRGAASNAESLVRGAVSQVPGMVGDLESLGRKGINFSFGPGGVKVDEKTVAPTSEEIRGMVPRITPARPESSGMESMGEIMAPGFGKAAAPVAKTLGKETARQVLRGMEGEGMLAPISPPMAYAVKPRGGTFATSGSLDKPELSKFDELLDKYAARTRQEVPEENRDMVSDFIDKKARKFFTTEYGTGDDALRNAMRTGELPLSGRDVERFPPYLLEAARNPNAPGHEIAKRHLEKFYDEQTGIEGTVLGLYNPADADARRLFNKHMEGVREEQRQLMTAEGVPNDFQNASISTYALPDLESYPTSTRFLKNLVDAGVRGDLPSGVQGAMQRQQPIYDISNPYMDFLSPKQVAENIAALPANKLKNMSFADAMIEGGKKLQVYRDYDTAILKADKGGTIPRPVLDMFTKPFLSGSTGEWKQLTDAKATALEGKLMNHSVGGYADGESYGTTYTGLAYGGKRAFDEGLVKVYSLRDDKGMPTVTLEMAKSDGGKGDKWDITQIRSAFNSEPVASQWDDIFKFIEKGEKHIGQLKQNSYTKDRTGTAVPGSVVNWGSAYRDWKDGIDPLQGVQRSDNPPGWGQVDMAQGGAVERVYGDNRRYL